VRMQRTRVVWPAAMLICIGVLAGCGGHAKRERGAVPLLKYRPGLPLHVRVTARGRNRSLRLEQITYRSVDGSRVPALFAVGTARRPLGCLIYQGGLGQAKEQFPQLRESVARLGLATFTIDPRNTGARGGARKIRRALEKPESFLEMLVDTAVDLRVGLDYLEARPECRHNVAYLGTSFGGAVGVQVAARDHRIKAVVLTSLGAESEQAILVLAQVAKADPEVPALVPGAASDPRILGHAVRVLRPYDPINWIGKIAPRPLMLINGRFDPLVPPVDALQLAAAARAPKTVVYFDGGDDPFSGPSGHAVATQVQSFLSRTLHLRAAP
jgi:uncharacterized protein